MKADIYWLDDPQVFRVNALPARSDHDWFRNDQERVNQVSSYAQCLDGEWKFYFASCPQDRPRGFYDPAYDDGDWGTIAVPSMIELNNYAQNQYINTFYPWEGKIFRRPSATADDGRLGCPFSQGADNSVGAYRCHFDLDKGLCNLPVRIRFEGVERAYYLWLNGHFVGYAEDSFAPHEFDLTPFIKARGNLLAVEVFKHSTASWLEDQDMFRFSGIFRSVNLLAQARTHLEDFSLRPLLDADGDRGDFNLTANIYGQEAGSLRVLVKDADGQTVLDQEETVRPQVSIKHLKIKPVQLWDHRHPYLYQLLMELHDPAGRLLEQVPYRFGFGQVYIDRNHVLKINGHRLIINGVNRHEWDCRRGRCVSHKDMEADITAMLDNHITAVRTSHYPDQTSWYDLCDQAGIYVMAECNLESHGSWQKDGKVEPSYNVPASHQEWLAAVLDRARNNYETLKNHTSIFSWSLGNESYAGDDLVAMQDYFKKQYDQRLIHYEGVFHDPAYRGSLSDFESRMYAKPSDIAAYLSDQPDKPFISCEYMHSMGNSVGGLKEYADLVKQYPQDCGGFIWDFIDQALQVTDPVTGRQVMRYGGDFDDRHTDGAFCGDGLMFADRTPKPAMQEVKYYYGQLEKYEDQLR